MNTTRFPLVKLALAATALLFASQAALACTAANWSGNSGANVLASGPDGPDGKLPIARYSGVCAMQTEPGETAFVEDLSPGGIDRIIARFYVLNDLASGQSAQIYRGFSTTTGSGPLFTVSLSATGTVTLRDNITLEAVSQTTSNPWASVEIDWIAGSPGSISLSVDGQTPVTEAVGNDGSLLQSVRLGNLNGASGTLNFDAYESRRSTAVGRLCPGDADQSGPSAGFRDFADIDAIFVEFATLGGVPAAGNPDITEDGLVDFEDIDEVFRLFATLQGECPQ